MRILLVEDDRSLSELLTAILTEQQYVVDTATDGQAGLDLSEELAYDIILLDVMLPKIDGITLCRLLRARKHQIPILLMTAKDTSTDKVMGLDAGADDYLVKPIEPQELLARIRALLRRGQTAVSPILTWGQLKLDPSSCEVSYGSYPLRLTPKEYALLELFMRNSHRVYSRGTILDQLWAFEDIPGEDTVRAHIKGLRQKLKSVGAANLVETVYGLGYRLNPAYAQETVPEAPPTVGPPSSDTTKRQQTLAAVAQIWQRAQSKILERLNELEEVGEALRTNSLTPERRHTACQEAHKLAGSLGTFGIPQGSQLAKQIETLLQPETTLTPERADALNTLVLTLRQAVTATDSLKQSKETSEYQPQASTSIEGQPLLLIIDDDRDLAELLMVEAKTWGVQTAIAFDLKTARVQLQEHRPDIVLLDLSFADSEEDGLALLSELSEQAPPIPVLVFSGRNQLQDRLAVAQLKAERFLQKPAIPAQVLAAVTQVLQQPKSKRAHILVIDDDPVLLKMLHAILEPWGLQITALTQTDDFWKTLEAVSPDLLILDVGLPTVSGIDLCQAVRNDPNWNWLPILFLTAYTDADVLHRVFAAGADDYISKPIKASTLTTRIFNRLERSRVLQRRLERDTLTGLLSQQQASQELGKLLQLAKRSQQSLCVGVLQLDSLSFCSHPEKSESEQILRQIGQFLKQRFGHEDVVSRWNETEFVVGLYGVSRHEGVEQLAETLEALRLMKIPTSDGSFLELTLSAGLATYPQDGFTLQEVNEAAHLALTQAQSAGGDRVLLAGWQMAHNAASTDVAVVHPDATFATEILQALERRGYQGQWLDGQTALETLTGTNPQLYARAILIERNLKGTQGIKLLQRLARDKIIHRSKVILLSPEADEAETARKLGAFDYIMAPYSMAVLKQYLHRALCS